jgi:hypothetical protein
MRLRATKIRVADAPIRRRWRIRAHSRDVTSALPHRTTRSAAVSIRVRETRFGVGDARLDTWLRRVARQLADPPGHRRRLTQWPTTEIPPAE